MDNSPPLDTLFRTAVSAVDTGDIAALEQLLDSYPHLPCERLAAPGAWLREKVGKALDGFFKSPYLLWFVAEDPIRNGTLPPNIVEVTQTLVQAALRVCPDQQRQQLDYALQLVAWSSVAKDCGVQIGLIDVLLDAGASPAGAPENALVNGHVAAAAHLIARGAPLSLASALVLEKWGDAASLTKTATGRQKQFALTLCALRGRADALRRLVESGVDVNAVSPDLYSHATPLHHAVGSGSLDAVRVLVEAGARLDAVDTIHHATPLGWAEYSHGKAAYDVIAHYLRSR